MAVYLHQTPRAPLSEFVERMWLVTGAQSRRQERILPSGTVELVVNLHDDRVRVDRTPQSASGTSYSGAVVSGTYSGPFVIDAMQHRAMMGVHFRPGGALAVLGVPPGALANSHVDLSALWGDGAARGLRERLCADASPHGRFLHLEEVLAARLASGERPHPAVRSALESFTPTGSGASVRDVVRRTGLSHRRFLTLFTAEVGLSPKLFCRILRLQHVHARAHEIGPIDWPRLALECGFFDQSHLANEFRRLAGLTPTEVRRGTQGTPNLLSGHVASP